MSELTDLVESMFEILDTVEMSDEGREFHPTEISSCRAVDANRLEGILEQMRGIVLRDPPPKLRQRHEIEPDICPWCNGTGDSQNHERETNDCLLCKTAGRVKKCDSCDGLGVNNDDIYNQGKDCETCYGTGLTGNRNW